MNWFYLACRFVSGLISSRIPTLFFISIRQIQLTLACRLSHKHSWIRVPLPSTVLAKTLLLINSFSPRIYQSMKTKLYFRIKLNTNKFNSSYRFREMVSTFYQDVSNMPQIPDQEMNSTMQQLSMSHIGEFDTVAALKELYIYVNKYRVQLFENLEEENYCRKLQLAQRLANVACVMEGEETSAC